MRYEALAALGAFAVCAAAATYVALMANGRNPYRTDAEAALGDHPGLPGDLGSYRDDVERRVHSFPKAV